MNEEQINEDNDESNDILKNLLFEYRESRDSIKKMVVDLEKLTDKLLTLFPDKIDVRYRHLFEEKIRTVTDLYKTILDMRKEITSSIKNEIDMRRKIIFKEDEFNEEEIDIRSIADKVQNMFKKEKSKTEKKIDKFELLLENSNKDKIDEEQLCEVVEELNS